MSRTLPPLNALRAFEAAGRTGSFTRAAEELNVSHSAISRHVRGLERRLNVHLFRNLAQGVELTEQGRSFFVALCPAFDAIEAATENLIATPRGRVTLTSEPGIAQKWLVPRLGALEAAHPDIDLAISVSHEVADIAAHDFDMALRFVSEGCPTDGMDVISTAPVYPYAAPGFGGLDPATLNVETLARQRLISDHTLQLWHHWFRQAGLAEVPDLRLSNPLDAMLAIEAGVSGQGAVLMSEELTAPEVAAGKLVRLSDCGVRYGGFYLLVNRQAGRRKAVRAVRDWLIAESEPWRV